MPFKFIQTSLPCFTVRRQTETDDRLLPFSTLIDRLTFNNNLRHEAGILIPLTMRTARKPCQKLAYGSRTETV